MNYKIIIPTYQRPLTLIQKTLHVLGGTNIFAQPDGYELYVFVADENEYEVYDNYFEQQNIISAISYKIVTGVRGIPNQRNFIQNYFAPDDWLFMIDDDISKINTLSAAGKSVPLFDLHTFLTNAFTITQKLGLRMWGVNANTNPLNMDTRVSVGLIYLVGNFIGLINTHDTRTYVDTGALIPARTNFAAGKESHERAIKHYLTYGGVVKFKNLGVESKYWQEPGGHQVSRTIDGERNAAEVLLKMYPNLLQYREFDGVPDITFVTGKTKTYPLTYDFTNHLRQQSITDIFGI